MGVMELSLTPVIDISKAIQKAAKGGGTRTGLVFKYAVAKSKEGTDYDRVIILSDQESWADGWGWDGTNGSVQNEYKAYKKASGKDPFVYAIDIEGYGTKDVSSPKVKNLVGWSDRLLDFIGYVEEGDSMIDYVKNYNL